MILWVKMLENFIRTTYFFMISVQAMTHRRDIIFHAFYGKLPAVTHINVFFKCMENDVTSVHCCLDRFHKKTLVYYSSRQGSVGLSKDTM